MSIRMEVNKKELIKKYYRFDVGVVQFSVKLRLISGRG